MKAVAAAIAVILFGMAAYAYCPVPSGMSDEAQARYYDCLERERQQRQQQAREEAERQREAAREAREWQREQQEQQSEQVQRQHDNFCRQYPAADGCNH